MNETINIPFLNTIKHLRIDEEVILYRNIPLITAHEEELVADFLKEEYDNESTQYPYSAPVFNKEAALCGAKIVYYASLFLLYRDK